VSVRGDSHETVAPCSTGWPAFLVGTSYFAGALVPVLLVLVAVRTALSSLVAAGSLIVVVSVILAFLAGMEMIRSPAG
jgi:vacuolar iron transporter family protein